MRSLQVKRRDNCKERQDTLKKRGYPVCLLRIWSHQEFHEYSGEWSDSKVIKLGIDPWSDLDAHLPNQEGGVIDGC